MTDSGDEVLVPDRPALEGLRFRRFRGGDWPAIADLVRAAHRADGVELAADGGQPADHA